MGEYLFEWTNGCEIAEGKDYIDACRHLKANPAKIHTGFLVRIKDFSEKYRRWGYWDAEMFWKNLGEKGMRSKRKRDLKRKIIKQMVKE